MNGKHINQKVQFSIHLVQLGGQGAQVRFNLNELSREAALMGHNVVQDGFVSCIT